MSDAITSDRITADLSYPAIDRPDLYDRLDAATAPGGRVVLLSAAAGTGKSVAVADWIRRRPPAAGTTVTWVDVTEPAADPCAAPRGSGGPSLLVVDDAQRITDPAALAALEARLRRLPGTMTVVLCARIDPALPWHALELRGRVTRIGAAELALTVAQTRALCAQHGYHPEDGELAALRESTGGWAAPTRILAARLALDHPAGRSVADLRTHPPRALSDFLTREVLDPLPAELRRFLLCTGAPAAFTTELAAVLGGPSAQLLLRELERRNIPITRIVRDDGLWFEHHPLLHAQLRAELPRLGAELVAELDSRAARWFDDAGLPLPALPHLLDATATDRLADCLRRHGMTMVLDGDGPTLFAHLDRARPELSGDPYLALLRAVDALGRGDTTPPASPPDRHGATSVAPAPWLAPLARAADIDMALRTDRPVGRQVAAPTTGHLDLDCYLTVHLASARVLHGDREDGEARLRHGLTLATRANRPGLALRAVTGLAVAAGRADAVGTMRDRAAKAIAVAAEHDLDRSVDALHATGMAAFGAYLQGESGPTDQTEALLATLEDADGTPRPAAGWSAHVVGRLLDFHRGPERHTAAEDLRSAMLALLERGGPLPVPGRRLLLPVVWALLTVREPRTARLLVEYARTTRGDEPEVALAQAALALVAGGAAATLPMLAAAHERSAELATTERTTLWLLDAVTAALTGAPHPAGDRLRSAVELAAPEQLVRPFLDVPGVIEMLDDRAGTFGRREDFVNRIRRHPGIGRTAAEPPLTAAEITVLTHLPSGRTAQQIAADLGVSVNTVKTHLHRLYAKLGVNSRMDAIGRGRRIGLL
ncbi:MULTISPECIES: LuxR C-terminal-related transcriptional regulator [unclassified Nocardia]|uniref:helix-turn-helix transcriptional regulator n=2 Tax=Nocardia TaxID=1817 RepID=UPI00278C724D|nr:MULTISPECIES: LuxR C-terminal-related transcriptional regulator [unclassified Nocardia]